MSRIKKLDAREVIDSRGNPTVEVDLILADDSVGRAIVPSGASTGSHEAVELRDGDPKRFNGKGVLRAVANVEGEITQHLQDQDFDQSSLDQELITLDGTPNKSHLGANAILGVSLAFAHAQAAERKVELYRIFTEAQMPVPMFNILNGGRHAMGSTDIQEFMIVPIGAPNFSEALRWSEETYQALKKILNDKGLDTDVGDEGGFAPKLENNSQAIELLVAAINQAGYQAGKDIAIALDVAASELALDNNNYELKKENKTFTSNELINLYEDWVAQYPIISIEDGLAEDDWTGWQELTIRLGNKINIVGDDLFATNVARLHQGIDQQVANAIIIKPNQIGTLTETLEVIKLAKSANYKIIISHRSGETEDTTIADLAVGIAADFIKAGAPARSERLAKYNRLLEIEEQLKK